MTLDLRSGASVARPLWVAVALALGACVGPALRAPAPTPVTSVPAAAATAPESDAPTAPGSPTPAPVARYAPPPPLSIVARAPGAAELRAFHLGGDGTLLVARYPDGELRFARVAGSSIERLTGLAPLPVPVGALEALVAGGRLPDALWLGVNAPQGCAVFRRAPGGWRAEGSVPHVACTHLAAFTTDAALGATSDRTDGHLALHAFGAARTTPQLTPAVRPGCTGLLGNVHTLATWPTGDVVVVGFACDEPRLLVQRWAPGATVAATLELRLDENSPFDVRPADPGEIHILGMGSLPGAAPGEVRPIDAGFGVRAGSFAPLGVSPAELSDLERWLTLDVHPGPASATAEGFEHDRLEVGARGEAFVTGRVLRPDGSALPVALRSLPVAEPLEL
ncbi:MAG: hypothetical protein HY908_18455 [Myxococcales bacterium]|nr:hypothetical protein [Myxococcales bacterium]